MNIANTNMVRVSFICFVLACLVSCGGTDNRTSEESDSLSVQEQENTGIGKIEFVESAFDFGQVKEVEIEEHVFSFKNTGTASLILYQIYTFFDCILTLYTPIFDH